MKVSVLQQFLRNLIAPLQAGAASAPTIAALQLVCQGLDPFQDKDVADFAEFLTRAAAYERDGKWPSPNPPISGRIVDEPDAPEYARRLRTFLEREVPSGHPISDEVRMELNRLVKRLKTAQVKEMARELQVEDGFRGKKQGIEKIVFRLTGQRLRARNPRAPRRTAVELDSAILQQYAAELRNLAEGEARTQRVKELVKQLKGPDLRALAESLGASGTARTTKEGWGEKILAVLAAPPTGDKITRLTEILFALKAKAEGPDAPIDEIEAELRSLQGQMDRDEAVAVAKRFGVTRSLDSPTEALEEIRRKVFETKRERESVAL
jgi:phage gp16-like protein